MKERILNKAKRLFLAAILAILLAIITAFVLNRFALGFQEMLGQLFRVGFEGGILILFGEIAVGWPIYTALLYVILTRRGLFAEGNDIQSLNLFH